MIISASRRTDIPSYYSDWFFNRIKEGFVLVRNPMNFHQVSRIKLTPDVVDGIVFWTKNPLPMLGRLGELKEYAYYFQFTITPYGKDIEPNLPQKCDELIPIFKRLSGIIGADRVIWRYDPILLNSKYTIDYHIRAFEKIARELHNYTRRVTFSFIDTHYRGVKNNANALALSNISFEAKTQLAASLALIAQSYNLKIDACAEEIDLARFGIDRARCIDGGFFEQMHKKDKNQRLQCDCSSSIDIGMYNTCPGSCRYCYANYSAGSIMGNCAKHSLLSALISGDIVGNDKISERGVNRR